MVKNINLSLSLSLQVTQNLLQDGEGNVSPVLSPQPPSVSQNSSPVACYPCDHQLQYQRIMSKPGSTANNKNEKEEHAGTPPVPVTGENVYMFYRYVSLLL